jgi:hypothetical protein
MIDGMNHDPTTAMSDGRNDPEQQIDEEKFFSIKPQTSS